MNATASPRGSTGPRLGTALRQRLVESPRSWGERARQRRWSVFADHFPTIAELDIVDLGGTVESWQRAPVHPRSVTVVNLTEPGAAEDVRLRPVLGDACRAREVLAAAGLPVRYDLVFSNSLLEHVGGHGARAALAEEITTLAPRHWVQTPYRYFPLEPHWLFPGMQFLPVSWRTRVAHRWPLTHTRPDSVAQARSEVLWTELISRTELAHYLPGSDILSERMAGLTKSIIAVRGAAGGH